MEKKTIYLIIESKGSYDDYCETIVGWCDTEEQAAEEVDRRNKLIPRHPYEDSYSLTDRFESIYNEWLLIEDDLSTDLERGCPYKCADGSITDWSLYEDWCKKVVKPEINKARLKWFNEISVLGDYKSWDEVLDKYDAWTSVCYQEIHAVVYKECKQL